MKSISALPCEVIGLILANCEIFGHLRHAIFTCKTFYSAWKSHTGSIIWHVGQSEIVGFTDALIAVRATGIAKEAILRGDLPPSPFPLGELSGELRKPTLDEMKILFDFQHLVECLERLAKKHSDPYWFGCIESLESEDRNKAWIVWKERFHVAMYRSFVSGAALYRAYYEPLTLASTCGLQRFLDQYRRHAEAQEEEEEDNGDGPFTSAEKRYLLQHPIFRFEEFQQHGDIFQPLADIFVQESKRKAKVVNTLRGASLYERYGARQYDPDILERSHSQALFHQLLQFLSVTDSPMLGEIIRNEDGSEYHQRRNEPTPKEMSGRRRTVTVIFFDVFNLEEIIMPENVDDAVETFVLARPGVRRPVVAEGNFPDLKIRSAIFGTYSTKSNGSPASQIAIGPTVVPLLPRLNDTWDWENSRNHDPPIRAWTKFAISGDVFCERLLADEFEGACALFESIDAPIPEPYFVHGSSWS
ncbi:hypothetical protein CNMCM5793_008193 [Aspergillus hiratsukae]|uniref:Uncharacterized protein n=1 Tax=Aspergillus hiratsukae TaxID=1194566 RepID=A0A8H6UQU3_9EURO|nr:hypothetical protein CNMCM5793_008193 [Aspergillus hiratsukae]KAF7163708.1 hypothetical protein CNMCM6106_000524 [Aspergillus hiratsukae]